jgi:GTPase
MDLIQSPADEQQETALLIAVQQRGQTVAEIEDSLDELAQLTGTAGGCVVGHFICRQDKPHPGHFVGRGKAEEIRDWIVQHHPATVIFDDELSPAQGRNLEKLFQVKVIDRTQMILDIFAQHARTKEGCLQIELAQLGYLLPRLRRMWTHLERQKGGIGMHGPGESQLETDRRRIEERMARIRKELVQVRRHRQELRRGRRRHGWALASLVGYTNAGKSTLLNALTDAQVKAEDQLFATLDPTTRQVALPNQQPMLLTDTVGFIRKLPHGLVESFKATLEEVVEADLLIHVIDASHPNVDAQIEAVHVVLEEIGAQDKPVVPVLNKIDTEAGQQAVSRLRRLLQGALPISAHTGAGLDHFLDELCDRLRDRNVRMHLRIPLREGKKISLLRGVANVLAEEYEDEYVLIDAHVPLRHSGSYHEYTQST